MSKIKLTKGKSTIVDSNDFEYLNGFKWCLDRGCAKRRDGKKMIWMHNVIMDTTKGKEIDHINNDGNKQRKNGKYTGGTANFYYWIKTNNYPTDLQVLCYNCNMAKAIYKICPHKQMEE